MACSTWRSLATVRKVLRRFPLDCPMLDGKSSGYAVALQRSEAHEKKAFEDSAAVSFTGQVDTRDVAKFLMFPE